MDYIYDIDYIIKLNGKNLLNMGCVKFKLYLIMTLDNLLGNRKFDLANFQGLALNTCNVIRLTLYMKVLSKMRHYCTYIPYGDY